MAFIPYKNNRGAAVSFKYMPAAAEAFVIGEALKLDSGKVAKCTGTTTPEFIAMEKKTIGTAGDPLYVLIIEPTTEFETEVSGSTTVGAKYTIDSDGLKITTTTSSGVAEALEVDGSTSGDRCVVRFPG